MEPLAGKPFGLSPVDASIVLVLPTLFCWILLSGLNEPLFLDLNRWAGVFPESFWEILTRFGEADVSLALLGSFALFSPRKYLRVLLGGLLLALLVQALKWSFNAPRPPLLFEAGKDFRLLGESLFRLSFPSGHSATFFFVASALVRLFGDRRLRGIVWFLAFAVGISRIAVGVHFPLDVLAGAWLGHLAFLLTRRFLLTREELFPWCGRDVLLCFVAALLTAVALLHDVGTYSFADWVVNLSALGVLFAAACGVWIRFRKLPPR